MFSFILIIITLLRLSLRRGFDVCGHGFDGNDGFGGLGVFDGLGGFGGFDGLGRFDRFGGFDGFSVFGEFGGFVF